MIWIISEDETIGVIEIQLLTSKHKIDKGRKIIEGK
jgi:hypothetical protein